MAPIVHLHPLSSYCWKVLIALYETGAAFEPAMVNFGDPEAAAAFRALGPTGKIPLLEDRARGRVVPETSIMIEYLQAHYPAGAPMLPEDPEARLEARLWDRLFDFYVMTPMGRITYEWIKTGGDTGTEPAREARAELQKAYVMVDAHMAGRTWAAGEAFSIADCSAAPSLFYALVKEPAPAELTHLAAYMHRLRTRPSVARVLEEAKPWFQYYPFKDRLPDEFRPAAA